MRKISICQTRAGWWVIEDNGTENPWQFTTLAGPFGTQRQAEIWINDMIGIMLTATARQIVKPGGRVYWIGGITKYRGHPFIVDCCHRHDTRREAIECAECLFHAPAGSIVAEELAKHK